MEKKRNGINKRIALLLTVLLCTGCGSADEETVQNEIQAVQPTPTTAPASPTEAPPTEEPTATPVPTQVPLKDLVFVRPSFANVTSGADSHADERGSFIVSDNELIVQLPTDDANGYRWKCIDNYEDGIFTFAGGDIINVPYTYTSGKYGGTETPKSEVDAAEDALLSQQQAAEEPAPAEEAPAEDAGEEYEEEIIYYYEEVPEEIWYEEVPVEEGYEEVPADGEYVETPEEGEEVVYVEGVSFEQTSLKGGHVVTSFSPLGKKSGLKTMSSVQDNTPEVEMTYVYAPSRTEFTFTPQSAGTDIYYLEYTKGEGTASELDSGFILITHWNEEGGLTFDLAWYSFADCVAAPNRLSESDASIVSDQVEAQEAEASEAFDSCVRNDNTIGTVANMVEDAYWEVYSVDPAVATVTSNGGSFYHEDFVDYAWDMFSVNPAGPGRTTIYFIYMTGDDTVVPRIQVTDVHVADDMTVTMHVRRTDMGVQFD